MTTGFRTRGRNKRQRTSEWGQDSTQRGSDYSIVTLKSFGCKAVTRIGEFWAVNLLFRRGSSRACAGAGFDFIQRLPAQLAGLNAGEPEGWSVRP